MTACGVGVTFVVATKWGAVGIAAAVVLGLCSLFFGAVAVLFGVRLVSPRPMLVVDGDGILDAAAPFGVGRLGWDEVISAHVRNDANPPFVSVDVTDPEAVAGRQGPLGRLLIRLTARRYGVVTITSDALDIPAESVVAAIEEWIRYRRGVSA
jgi:hypothetical protein